MSKFRRIGVAIVCVMLLVIVLGNVLIFVVPDKKERPYRVEAKSVAMLLKTRTPEEIDLGEYPHVLAITLFDPAKTPNNDYIIAEHDGEQYAVEYTVGRRDNNVLIFNGILGLMFLIVVFMIVYVDRKILRPFNSMTSLTLDLAKGNLSNPIKEEKNRFFGKFLWGMDMLRENLEDSKKRELEYQKEKKTLVLSLSHDIKTPLSAIELYTRALKDDIYDTPEKKTNALNCILKNADEIKHYAGEISKISREDFLDLKVNVGEVYLDEVMSKIEIYYKDKLSVLHTEFVVEPHDNCLLACDADRLVEVLQNFMENAIKYGDGSSIRITFSDEEDCRLICVTNTGVAPDETEMQSLFDSFYRGKNTAGINGSGLGLYIARNLMQKMDGDVFANAGEGTFSVTAVVRKA